MKKHNTIVSDLATNAPFLANSWAKQHDNVHPATLLRYVENAEPYSVRAVAIIFLAMMAARVATLPSAEVNRWTWILLIVVGFTLCAFLLNWTAARYEPGEEAYLHVESGNPDRRKKVEEKQHDPLWRWQKYQFDLSKLVTYCEIEQVTGCSTYESLRSHFLHAFQKSVKAVLENEKLEQESPFLPPHINELLRKERSTMEELTKLGKMFELYTAVEHKQAFANAQAELQLA